jgi:hypothetical protein
MSTHPAGYALEPGPVEPALGDAQPYPPSIVDRLMSAVERLPVPYWLTYLLLILLQGLLFHAIAWFDGWADPFTFHPIFLLFPIWLWAPLAFMTYLDRVAVKALASFCTLLELPPAEMERLRYEFTTMPARGVLLGSLVWGILYVAFTTITYDAVYVASGYTRPVAVTAFLAGLVSFMVGSAIYYHSIRQLRLVNRTVSRVDHFDLFRLDPVYAFSELTARTGIAWVILLTLTLLTTDIRAALLPALSLMVLQVLLAIGAFVLPLGIVHGRLVAEKKRLLAEHDLRAKALLARFHDHLQDEQYVDMIQLNNALIATNAEQAILSGIRTWPWPAGLLTGFLSIVALPIILFIIQQVVGRWLGG